MKKATWVFTLATVALAGPALLAQQAQAGGSGSGGQGQGRGQEVVTVATGTDLSMINVRLELTITDQTASGQPVKKSITMLLAERGEGRVRSGGQVYRTGTEDHPVSAYQPVTLNADAHISTIQGDRIRAAITVVYQPATAGPAGTHGVSSLNQTVTVVLASGKPTLIVESTDPIADRKVTLEATATIVR